MFGFPEDLKSYFFHKSVNDIKDLNSGFNFENPINSTKNLVYFNESILILFTILMLGMKFIQILIKINIMKILLNF